MTNWRSLWEREWLKECLSFITTPADRTTHIGRYGIVANVVDDKVLRQGARVWLIWVPGDPTSVQVEGLSLGGRIIQKWITTSRLRDFRVKWASDETRSAIHPSNPWLPPRTFDTKDAAQEVVDWLTKKNE